MFRLASLFLLHPGHPAPNLSLDVRLHAYAQVDHSRNRLAARPLVWQVCNLLLAQLVHAELLVDVGVVGVAHVGVVDAEHVGAGVQVDEVAALVDAHVPDLGVLGEQGRDQL